MLPSTRPAASTYPGVAFKSFVEWMALEEFRVKGFLVVWHSGFSGRFCGGAGLWLTGLGAFAVHIL